MKKKCSKCKLEKDASDFSKDKRTRSGLYSACRKCHYTSIGNHAEYQARWREKHPENKEYQLRWWKEHPGYNARRQAILRRIPQNKLSDNMGNSIRSAIRGKKEGRKWQELVGYTLQDLMVHLESQFDDKMSWRNHGSYWHIDHIKPISLFKYETAENPEFKKCWSLDNLQPLEATVNLRKSNRFSLV